MTLSMGLIKADIIAAGQAIAYYEAHSNKNIKNIAAYHLQQASEKMIKIQIYSVIASPDYAKLYTHNLEKLIVYADSLGQSFDIPDYIRSKSLEITDWEAGSRYDIGFTVRVDVLKKVYTELEKWYDRLRDVR